MRHEGIIPTRRGELRVPEPCCVVIHPRDCNVARDFVDIEIIAVISARTACILRPLVDTICVPFGDKTVPIARLLIGVHPIVVVGIKIHQIVESATDGHFTIVVNAYTFSMRTV